MIVRDQKKLKVAKVFHEFTAFGLADGISVVAPADTDLRCLNFDTLTKLRESFPDQYNSLQMYVQECMASPNCLSNDPPPRMAHLDVRPDNGTAS